MARPAPGSGRSSAMSQRRARAARARRGSRAAREELVSSGRLLVYADGPAAYDTRITTMTLNLLPTRRATVAPLATLLLTAMLIAAGAAAAPAPPVAEKIPHPTTLHGDTRPDDYFWLREKQNPKVIAYLEAENGYTDSMTVDGKALRDSLYKEMLGRIKQTDLSVPYRKGAFLYYSRTEEGKQYPILCRRKGDMKAPEELMLDVNALAEGHRFMGLGNVEVSPDGTLLAYTTDSTGYRQYVLAVKDLSSGKTLTDHAERVTSVAWAADGKTLFYTQEDSIAKRPYRLYRHALGTNDDPLIYEEKDEHFEIDVGMSRSGAWLIQTRGSHTTSEVAVLPANAPTSAWNVVAPRVHGREYYLDHRGDRFWIRVNDKGKNYRLVTAPVATPD